MVWWIILLMGQPHFSIFVFRVCRISFLFSPEADWNAEPDSKSATFFAAMVAL
jgi:hypothetical protein